MSTWMQLAYAIPLVLMLVYLWPSAKRMLRESPKGSARDWQGILLPLAAVILFVLLLISMVRP